MIARSAAHQIKYYGLAVSGWVFTRAGPGPYLEPHTPYLEVHRQGGAQIAEPRVHFAANRAATGADGAVPRQQSGSRLDFIEIFRNCQVSQIRISSWLRQGTKIDATGGGALRG